MDKPPNRSSPKSKGMRHRNTGKGQGKAGDIWDGTNEECPGWFDQLISWDVELTGQLAICATPTSPYARYRPIMKFLELSCHGVPWFIFVLASIMVSFQPFVLELLVNLLTALIFDILVICMLKVLASRDRPSHNQDDMFATVSIDKKSFPSGHATRATMLATFFIYSCSQPLFANLLIASWAVFVCISRVFLGRHHVLDVAVGAVVGVLEYLIMAAYLWLSRDKCMEILRPIHEETHL